jgi:hypothetical protein
MLDLRSGSSETLKVAMVPRPPLSTPSPIHVRPASSLQSAALTEHPPAPTVPHNDWEKLWKDLTKEQDDRFEKQFWGLAKLCRLVTHQLFLVIVYSSSAWTVASDCFMAGKYRTEYRQGYAFALGEAGLALSVAMGSYILCGSPFGQPIFKGCRIGRELVSDDPEKQSYYEVLDVLVRDVLEGHESPKGGGGENIQVWRGTTSMPGAPHREMQRVKGMLDMARLVIQTLCVALVLGVIGCFAYVYIFFLLPGGSGTR